MTLSRRPRSRFKEINDIVVENRITETSIILIPSSSVGQGESKLYRGVSYTTVVMGGGGLTCTAVYAIDRGVTDLIPSRLATLPRVGAFRALLR